METQELIQPKDRVDTSLNIEETKKADTNLDKLDVLQNRIESLYVDGYAPLRAAVVPYKLIKNKSQVRKRFKGIEELAESIREEGLQSPIIVSERKDGEEFYQIQKGERRWRACGHAGLKEVAVIIAEKPENEASEIYGEVTENIQRDSLEPMEIAEAIGRLIDLGHTSTQISKRLGKPASYVSRHKKLLELPKQIVKLYEDELVTDPDTLNSLRSLYEENEIACKKLVKKIKDNGGITRKEVQTTLRKEKDRQANNLSRLGTTDDTDNALPGAEEGSQELTSDVNAQPALKDNKDEYETVVHTESLVSNDSTHDKYDDLNNINSEVINEPSTEVHFQPAVQPEVKIITKPQVVETANMVVWVSFTDLDKTGKTILDCKGYIIGKTDDNYEARVMITHSVTEIKKNSYSSVPPEPKALVTPYETTIQYDDLSIIKLDVVS